MSTLRVYSQSLLSGSTLRVYSSSLLSESTLRVYSPSLLSEPTFQAYPPSLLSEPTLRVYSPSLLSEPTLRAYPLSLLSEPTLRVYSPRLLSASTLRVYSPSRLSEPTLRVYSPCLLSTSTLRVYSPSLLSEPTLRVYSLCLLSMSTLHVYSPSRLSESTLRVYSPCLLSASTLRVYSPSLPSESTLRVYSPCLLSRALSFYIHSSDRFIGNLKGSWKSLEKPSTNEAIVNPDFHLVAPDVMKYPQPSIVKGRTDVVAVTPWLAPIVWEGTFSATLLDGIYIKKNISVAATVFAVGKYIMFLKDFLETAEQHFFVGFRVHIYVFTDRQKEVPVVQMAEGREVTVQPVPSSNRWQEISARRMELIQTLIEKQIINKVNYIFCLDVDSKFHGRWGTESLGGLVSVIHPGYYKNDRSIFPYERRSSSRAFIAHGDGDFYYCGGAFGGLVQEVHQLAKTCRKNFEDDAKDGIEAAWQEESHLNRYMWINKPSKVLSPEYLWQDFKTIEPEVKLIRFSGVTKNYAAIRPN
ncbi:globoside alpha-1,3-N-acetylgalactosaminyltransferase 1 [Nematolebias whitei]|uniref:globoside alpha-1,3-N-acetylgalactosaminyltransferase 1 n=1 Tax=Nematolebias whitei TaxID=451745 RepID=UPI00189935DA|nr:globoside alpha-1,3-N-acetylgalactosaminyltransferase 1 [Nematolebias whitei]